MSLKGRDLVVFSNDWHGDPLSKTHIMRILARDNRVLWVDSIGNRAPKANVHDARRMWGKLRRFAGGLREVERNIWVLSPLAIPLYGSALARAVNGQALRAQVMRAMRALRFGRPLSWSYLPASAPVSGSLGEELVVYQCVDEFSAFSDTNGRQIADLEKQLLGKADLVITSAERLQRAKERLHPNTVLVRHGVDWSHFSKACLAETEVPLEVRDLPRPVLGFFGLIAPWVDLEAIAACARAYPNGSVVLVGKVARGDVAALSALPNVRWLGQKPYAQLPGYCRAFDVALMPFALNELTLNANPLKVREYLAAGLPVVSSAIPEVERLGLCRIAPRSEDFPRCVAEALAEGAGPSLGRAERVRGESWEARVDEISAHVERALAQAPASSSPVKRRSITALWRERRA